MTTPTPASGDALKTGWQTTEFWTAGVAPLVISLLTLFNIGHIDLTNNARAQAAIKVGALLAAAISAGLYAHSRGHAKAGASIKAGIQTLSTSLGSVNLATFSTLDPKLFASAIAEVKKIDPQLSEAQLTQLTTTIIDALGSKLPAEAGQTIEKLVDAGAAQEGFTAPPMN